MATVKAEEDKAQVMEGILAVAAEEAILTVTEETAAAGLTATLVPEQPWDARHRAWQLPSR